LVRGNLTVVPRVDAREVLICAEAAQKGTILVGSWGIVFAANTIVDVLAIFGSVRTSRVASLQTEDTTTHEAGELGVRAVWAGWKMEIGNALVPLDDLDEVGGVERLGEDETTEGVTTLVGTVGVHFTSSVIGSDVD